MIVSRCEKALRSGARHELLQTGPCSSRLGWDFFKIPNLDNTRISLKRFRLQFAAKVYLNLKMVFAMFLKVSVLYFLL